MIIVSKSPCGRLETTEVLQIDKALTYGDHTQGISYTPFHQPDVIQEATNETGASLYFKYGPDYERREMDLSHPYTVEGDEFLTYAVRRYNGNYEEYESAGYFGDNVSSRLRKIHYIEGGDGICAVYVQTIYGFGEQTDSIFYVYKDYLGSLLTFTHETTEITYEQNFDAWGRYRNTEDWSYEGIRHRPEWMFRGYTGHEHLYGMASWSCGDCHDDNGEYHSFVAGYDVFNLINMNGRLYDPVNGRMLSVDNYSHDGLGSQGHNRYTYAGNNPLKYTDP